MNNPQNLNLLSKWDFLTYALQNYSNLKTVQFIIKVTKYYLPEYHDKIMSENPYILKLLIALNKDNLLWLGKDKIFVGKFMSLQLRSY